MIKQAVELAIVFLLLLRIYPYYTYLQYSSMPAPSKLCLCVTMGYVRTSLRQCAGTCYQVTRDTARVHET